MKKALSILALAALLSDCQTAPQNLASIKDDQPADQARIMVTPMFVSGASGDAAFAMLLANFASIYLPRKWLLKRKVSIIPNGSI